MTEQSTQNNEHYHERLCSEVTCISTHRFEVASEPEYAEYIFTFIAIAGNGKIYRKFQKFYNKGSHQAVSTICIPPSGFASIQNPSGAEFAGNGDLQVITFILEKPTFVVFMLPPHLEHFRGSHIYLQ